MTITSVIVNIIDSFSLPYWVLWCLLFVINHQTHFKMVHSCPNNSKSRACQYQVCYLHTTHLYFLKQYFCRIELHSVGFISADSAIDYKFCCKFMHFYLSKINMNFIINLSTFSSKNRIYSWSNLGHSALLGLSQNLPQWQLGRGMPLICQLGLDPTRRGMPRAGLPQCQQERGYHKTGAQGDSMGVE